MILGQLDGLATLAHDAACITGITNVQVRGSDEYHVGSATSLIGIVLSGNVVRVLATDALEFLAPVRRQ